MILCGWFGRIFTLQRIFLVFGGIWLVLFTRWWWNWTKPSLRSYIELYWCDCAEHCAKGGHNSSKATIKWFYSMRRLGLTFSNPLNLLRKPHMGSPANPAIFPRSYAVRISLFPFDGSCSGWSGDPIISWHIKMAVFLECPQNLNIPTVMLFEVCQKDGKTLSPAMGHIWIDSFITKFSQ